MKSKKNQLLNPEVLLNILEDLEEEKEKLKKSEENLKIITENVMEAIFTKDINRKYTFVNPAAAKMIGFSVEKIIGKTPEELFSKEDAQKIKKVDDVNFKGKKIERIEKITIDKQKHFLHTSQNPLKDGNKKVIGIVGVVRDVTEEKKSERELKESELNLNKAQEMAHIGSWELDVKTKVVSGSKELFNIFEIPQNHPSLDVFSGVVYPGDKKFDLGKIERGMKYGESWNIKHRLLMKDKRVKWVHAKGEAIKNKKGEIVRLIGTVRDITAERKIEEKLKQLNEELELKVDERTKELQKSEVKFRSLVESTPDWIWEVNSKGVYTYVSPSIKNILGYSPKEILGKTPFDLMTKEDAKKIAPEFAKNVKLKKSFSGLINKNKHKNGKIITLETSGVPIIGPKERLLGYRGIDRNITELKHVRGELKEFYEKSNTMYESSSDAIMILEPPTWKFTAGNPSTIKMFKVKNEEDLVARAPWQYSPKKQPDGKLSSTKAKEMITIAMEKGKNFFEWEHKRLDGETFSATVLLTRMEIKGKKVLQATVRDISKEKESKRKLKESYKKLKELDILKSRFLTITSHELKTPLTPAKIQTQMMLQGDLGKLNKKQKKSFDIILRNITRLNELIEDILEISRIQAEGFKLKLSKIQLEKYIGLAVKSMIPVAEKRGLELNYKLDNLPLIIADKKRITEVLINLIENAIKFTHKGKINIEAKREKGHILVKIKDTGIGISKKEYKKIFHSFTQLEGTYTRKYGGTGLGLSICKGIIKQHGGKIWVESILGKGSTFYFTLPIKKLK
jgi:PAS domain S-box-containing protein